MSAPGEVRPGDPAAFVLAAAAIGAVGLHACIVPPAPQRASTRWWVLRRD